MDEGEQPLESKFAKSLLNRKTENAGLRVLLGDSRFQVLPTVLKREVAHLFGFGTEFGTQAFDAVMTDSPAPMLTALNLPEWADHLHLVEMKTTRKPVDDHLGGFFFGVTERELNLADRLGDRYLFAFVVLNETNMFGRAFFVLLTAEELRARIQTQRTQYQVNLVRSWTGSAPRYGMGPVGLRPKIGDSRAPEVEIR